MPYDSLKSLSIGHHELRDIIINLADDVKLSKELLGPEVLHELAGDISYLYWCEQELQAVLPY